MLFDIVAGVDGALRGTAWMKSLYQDAGYENVGGLYRGNLRAIFRTPKFKRRITQTTPCDSTGTLVFGSQKSLLGDPIPL